ncbi:hypothetical protein ACHAWF_007918 [Thalassiosira exigua]
MLAQVSLLLLLASSMAGVASCFPPPSWRTAPSSPALVVLLSLAPLGRSAGAGEDVDAASTAAAGDAAADAAASSEADVPEQECANPDGAAPDVRIITHDELALHTGKGGASAENPIWLSILGKVYDVTTGEDYYGEEKGSYRFYAGRDASPCFSTGNNTPEGVDEKLEEWEDKKLMAVWEWGEFYEKHDTYTFLGVLGGSRYYDEAGVEQPLRKDIVVRCKEAKRIADEERERKKQERLARRKNKNKK